MPFAWRDFLPFAQQLQQASDEVSLRTAVSRAYYAVYGTAKARLAADGIRLVSNVRGSHRQVWVTYKKHHDQRRKQIGVQGERLHRRRVRADYELVMSQPAREAGVTTRAADQLIRDIDAL